MDILKSLEGDNKVGLLDAKEKNNDIYNKTSNGK